MADNPYISIVIVNYNGINDTIECLESLKETIYPHYEIIVVDNGSEDNSIDVLKKRNDIRLIELYKNYGATYAWNVGFKQAAYEYVCFLNNDIVVDKNWLLELVKAM